MKGKLERGAIWKAIENVICEREKGSSERKIVVEKGELVEFRYPHNVHFRVANQDGTDIYLYLDEEVFIANFKYIGQVFEVIRFRNQNSMKQIIECKLYKEE